MRAASPENKPKFTGVLRRVEPRRSCGRIPALSSDERSPPIGREAEAVSDEQKQEVLSWLEAALPVPYCAYK